MRGTPNRGWPMRERTLGRLVVGAVCVVFLLAACGDDNGGGAATTTTAAPDPVAEAQARVDAANEALTNAQAGLDDSQAQFCADAKDYITAVDRYGQAFNQAAATVGDVTTAGADLEQPRSAVEASANSLGDARDAVAAAQQELLDAQAELAAAQAAASGATVTTSPPDTTTTSTIPPATIDRVKQAEDDLASASEGITAQTPVAQATVQFNSAAFALQVAWLQLFADAGCLTDAQQAQAAAAVHDYTVALQSELQAAGFYQGPVDGIYGPATVSAVEDLQTASGLPVTGLVDKATAAALDAAVLASGADAAALAMRQTVAVQTTLKLAGYWTGPIDGVWTDELTAALQAFQTALGVPPTGAVDPATLAALEAAIAALQGSATSTTTTTAPETTTTVPETTTTTA